MAAVISRIPHAAATIVPFDVSSRVESLTGRGPLAQAAAAAAVPKPGQAGEPQPPESEAPKDRAAPTDPAMTTPKSRDDYARPKPAKGVTPIGSLQVPGRATVEGRVHTVEIRPVEHNTVLACDLEDSTGQLTALFYGRSNITGLRPGSKVRLRGPVGLRAGRPVMINPAYELLAHGEPDGGQDQAS